jgi:hypothetical protein
VRPTLSLLSLSLYLASNAVCLEAHSAKVVQNYGQIRSASTAASGTTRSTAGKSSTASTLSSIGSSERQYKLFYHYYVYYYSWYAQRTKSKNQCRKLATLAALKQMPANKTGSAVAAVVPPGPVADSPLKLPGVILSSNAETPVATPVEQSIALPSNNELPPSPAAVSVPMNQSEGKLYPAVANGNSGMDSVASIECGARINGGTSVAQLRGPIPVYVGGSPVIASKSALIAGKTRKKVAGAIATVPSSAPAVPVSTPVAPALTSAVSASTRSISTAPSTSAMNTDDYGLRGPLNETPGGAGLKGNGISRSLGASDQTGTGGSVSSCDAGQAGTGMSAMMQVADALSNQKNVSHRLSPLKWWRKKDKEQHDKAESIVAKAPVGSSPDYSGRNQDDSVDTSPRKDVSVRGGIAVERREHATTLSNGTQTAHINPSVAAVRVDGPVAPAGTGPGTGPGTSGTSTLTGMVARKGPSEDAAVSQFEHAWMKERFVEAKELSAQILKTAPQSKYYASRYYVCCIQTADWSNALSALDRVVGLDQEHRDMYECDYGRILFELRKYEQAKSRLQHSIACGFDTEPVHRTLLLIAIAQKDDTSAEQAYRKIASLCPTDVDSRIELAELLWKHNRKDESIKLYDQVASMIPDNAEIQAKVGYANLHQANYKAAADAYKLASESSRQQKYKNARAFAEAQFATTQKMATRQ